MRVLHVGCGTEPLPLFFDPRVWQETRLDINPGVKPDIVGNIRQMPVSDGAFTAVYSAHNLEHLYAHEVIMALTEFRRALAPPGFLVVTMPDLEQVCRWVAEGKVIEPVYQSPAGAIAPIDILFGHRPSLAAGNLFMAHKTGFTMRSLLAYLGDADFVRAVALTKANECELWCMAFVTDPGDEVINDAEQHDLPSLAGITSPINSHV